MGTLRQGMTNVLHTNLRINKKHAGPEVRKQIAAMHHEKRHQLGAKTYRDRLKGFNSNVKTRKDALKAGAKTLNEHRHRTDQIVSARVKGLQKYAPNLAKKRWAQHVKFRNKVGTAVLSNPSKQIRSKAPASKGTVITSKPKKVPNSVALLTAAVKSFRSAGAKKYRGSSSKSRNRRKK